MAALRGHPPSLGARALRRVSCTCALAAALLCLPAAPARAAGCDRVAANGGSDKGPGTLAAPYATFKKLVHSLAPGQTGCLRAGTYRENVDVTAQGAPGAPVTVQSYPGEWATFLGRLTTDRSSAYVTFQSMTFDGSAAPSDGSELKPSPTVHGESISFIGNEVTNRNTAICFAVGNEDYGRAPNVVIRRNRIHNCGQLPPTNHQHGIYLHSPCCARVTDNWIYDNADTGVNLFPDADGNYIARNVMYGNGDNLSFAGRERGGACSSSDDNVIERNVISHPRVRKNITSWSPCGKHGSGNVLRENCIWPATFEGPEGYALVNNLYVEPQYVNAAAKDFRIVPGTPCAPLVVDPGVGGTGGSGAGKRRRAVSLAASRRWVRIGGRFVLAGNLAAGVSARRVVIEVRRRGAWARVRDARLRAGGRFRVVLRLRTRRDPARLRLGAATLPRGMRTLKLRARAPGAGRSAIVRLRVRR